jgi:hypothetical protein
MEQGILTDGKADKCDKDSRMCVNEMLAATRRDVLCMRIRLTKSSRIENVVLYTPFDTRTIELDHH